MAEKNRNRTNQSFKSNEDWDRISGQRYQDNEYDNDYGNVSRRDYDQYGNRDTYKNTGNYQDRSYRSYNDPYNDWQGSQYQSDNQQRPYRSGNYQNDYPNQQFRSSNYGNYSGQQGYQDQFNERRRRDNRYDNSYHRRDMEDRNWIDRASDEVASWFGDDEAERRRRMDKVSGPHKGKGPRGYQRSDERIREDVNDRLSDDPYVDASDIEVKVSDRCVVLSGTVNSREDKRRAEDIAESVSGVGNVENHIHVQSTERAWNRDADR